MFKFKVGDKVKLIDDLNRCTEATLILKRENWGLMTSLTSEMTKDRILTVRSIELYNSHEGMLPAITLEEFHFPSYHDEIYHYFCSPDWFTKVESSTRIKVKIKAKIKQETFKTGDFVFLKFRKEHQARALTSDFIYKISGVNTTQATMRSNLGYYYTVDFDQITKKDVY